jgi:hypothetical protein
MKALASLVAFCSVLLLAACASPSSRPGGTGPVIAIDGVRIINKLAITVTDVQILVPATGNFVTCGAILRNTACSTSFPDRQYERKPVQVSWKEQGQAHATPNFVIEPPANLDPARPVWIEVVIFAPGQAGAKLIQQPPKAARA